MSLQPSQAGLVVNTMPRRLKQAILEPALATAHRWSANSSTPAQALTGSGETRIDWRRAMRVRRVKVALAAATQVHTLHSRSTWRGLAPVER
jgi:hypothetical protein